MEEMKWDKEEEKLEMVCPRGGESVEEWSCRCRRAQGGMTGYSVSEVAHGEQVNIRDGEESRVKRVGKYSIWDGAYDARRKG